MRTVHSARASQVITSSLEGTYHPHFADEKLKVSEGNTTETKYLRDLSCDSNSIFSDFKVQGISSTVLCQLQMHLKQAGNDVFSALEYRAQTQTRCNQSSGGRYDEDDDGIEVMMSRANWNTDGFI